MTAERIIETFLIDWQGITLSVTYEADWLNMGATCRYATAHLQVQSTNPPRAPLPITKTGYRSLFISDKQVQAHGGPTIFARLWIEGAATSITWRNHMKVQKKEEHDDRQLSLF